VKRPLVFMFSGQGSQYFQMGKELYSQHPVFRRMVEHGDGLLRQRLQTSLAAEIYGRPRSDIFDNLRLSHPALLVIQYAMFHTLLSEGIAPDEVCGSSLGELIAAVAAGVWTFESALEAIMEQARLVETTCPRGGMLAIMANVKLYAELKSTGYDVTLAGINFENHFTVSGDAASLDDVEARLKSQGVVSQRLPLQYAFHSAAIDTIEHPFVRFCAALPINRAPQIPFLSVASGEYVYDVTPEYFWAVARQPMRFSETVQRRERSAPSAFVDCGPSGTLATFVKYNLAEASGSLCFPILTPFHRGMQQLAQLKDYCQTPRDPR
jgi:acyl transferase domain-containing protein